MGRWKEAKQGVREFCAGGLGITRENHDGDSTEISAQTYPFIHDFNQLVAIVVLQEMFRRRMGIKIYDCFMVMTCVMMVFVHIVVSVLSRLGIPFKEVIVGVLRSHGSSRGNRGGEGVGGVLGLWILAVGAYCKYRRIE